MNERADSRARAGSAFGTKREPSGSRCARSRAAPEGGAAARAALAARRSLRQQRPLQQDPPAVRSSLRNPTAPAPQRAPAEAAPAANPRPRRVDHRMRAVTGREASQSRSLPPEGGCLACRRRGRGGGGMISDAHKHVEPSVRDDGERKIVAAGCPAQCGKRIDARLPFPCRSPRRSACRSRSSAGTGALVSNVSI